TRWYTGTTADQRRPGSELGALPGLLLVGVALFLPGVADVVVAALLPEATAVGGHVLHAAHPLGALPGIQMGHHEAQREAVFRRQQFAVLVGGEDGPLGGEIRQAEVRTESVFGPH